MAMKAAVILRHPITLQKNVHIIIYVQRIDWQMAEE